MPGSRAFLICFFEESDSVPCKTCKRCIEVFASVKRPTYTLTNQFQLQIGQSCEMRGRNVPPLREVPARAGDVSRESKHIAEYLAEDRTVLY